MTMKQKEEQLLLTRLNSDFHKAVVIPSSLASNSVTELKWFPQSEVELFQGEDLETFENLQRSWGRRGTKDLHKRRWINRNEQFY